MLAYLFVVIAVVWRVIIAIFPYPLGFTPVAASLLFFGAKMERKRMWIPLLLLIGSDFYLTLFYYGYKLTADHFVTWAWYAAIIGLGGLLKENGKPLPVIGASLTASVSFFLVSNFAVWLVWNMYPMTLAGLLECYTVGLPYFRHSVLGDLLFTGVFFSVPAVLRAVQTEKAHKIAIP
jgi:hypothetical protein